jgi:hypothetical protein
MPANTTPIFPLTPIVGVATLTSPTAITSRANITGTTGLVQLTATSTNGTRVDAIQVKGKATNSASKMFVWVYNATTSYLFDEIDLPATTASTTTESVLAQRVYQSFVLPPTYQLFVSVSVAADINAFALGGVY